VAAPRLAESEITIERLAEEHFKSIETFDCGTKDENDYLKKNAWPNQCNRLSETYLLFEKKDHTLVSYITMTFGSFRLAGDRKLGGIKIKKKPFRVYTDNIPCLFIGKLATDKNEIRRNGASYLIDFAIQKVLKINKELVLPFLALDAYLDKIEFYHKKGFKVAFKPGKKDRTIRLYLEV
jgi:hypothetical protein